jgi:hypothetical protein
MKYYYIHPPPKIDPEDEQIYLVMLSFAID